ncbi:MAG TPA: hypothetical protein VJN21_01900 [Candidatus Acidoferrales bacterium]|nr:hypothetical protein [Candidatus Acidoferrales bacterium]
MAEDYIPFVNTEYDCQATTQLYSDAFAMRIGLEMIEKTRSKLPVGPKRWVDASIDGLHHKDLSRLSDNYQLHLSKFVNSQRIADPQYHRSPDKVVAEQFVFSVLDRCKAEMPDWISVPQLPLVSDTSRNKINKLFAELTSKWKVKAGYSGKLILPAILTHQNQVNKKTERNKKIISIVTCVAAAGADGIWVADATLNDQDGSGKFDERFPALRKFHEELNQAISENCITICGPYWGMNLILWARSCARYPAIGLGGSYKYNIPGQKLPKGKIRVALRPLRRWAIANPSLRTWLTDTVASLATNDPARADFAQIEKEWSRLQIAPNGKIQIATFYKNWFSKFSTLPQAGRALALYQDLSSSYVLGKTLKPLSADEETARRPERVAQQLMMNCL